MEVTPQCTQSYLRIGYIYRWHLVHWEHLVVLKIWKAFSMAASWDLNTLQFAVYSLLDQLCVNYTKLIKQTPFISFSCAVWQAISILNFFPPSYLSVPASCISVKQDHPTSFNTFPLAAGVASMLADLVRRCKTSNWPAAALNCVLVVNSKYSIDKINIKSQLPSFNCETMQVVLN